MLAAFESQQYIEANAMAQELAAGGDATAQYYLGRMFAEGLGTLQISKTAHMWFNIASLNGSAEAVTARNSVADTMSQTAVEEAQEMALLCIQSKYADCGLTIKPKASTKAAQAASTITDGSTVRNDFKAQTALRRKQLQYALKKLGVYSSTVDGLWGNNTSNAFTNYIKINSEEAANAEALFVSILSKVDVPTRFAAPRKLSKSIGGKHGNNPATSSADSHRTVNTGGLRPLIDNPSISGAQALAICEPQAKMAGENASRSYRSTSYGSSVNCSGYGYNINCNVNDNSGGFWGGFADGLGKGMARREARDAALNSCLAQYGWKE